VNLDTSAFGGIGEPIITLDSHTAGEPTRLVVGGLPPIPGKTINEKRLYVSQHLDHIRRLLTREPRGHRDMFAAIATAPTSPDGDFGLIFMDAARYPYMCGHGTIGAVTAFVEMGWLDIPDQGDELRVRVDTPSGQVVAHASLGRGSDGVIRADSVAIQLESAFTFREGAPLSVPEFGDFRVDLVAAGGFFAMVSSDQIALDLTAQNARPLAELGMAIIESGNEQLTVQHPEHPYVNTIDVTEFYDPAGHPPARGCNAVVYGDHHVDRSPCGTGTSAKMALLYSRGQMAVGDVLINEGLLGSTFEGRIVEATTAGDLTAIVPEIRAAAHITGLHHFIVRPDDPFPDGFLF